MKARFLFVSVQDNVNLLCCMKLFSYLTDTEIVEWFGAQGCSNIQIEQIEGRE